MYNFIAENQTLLLREVNKMLSYIQSCLLFYHESLFSDMNKISHSGCDVVRGARQELFSDDLWEHNSSC